MLITTRKLTLPDMLPEFQATMRREGRTFCPVTDWIAANQDKSFDDFVQMIAAHQEWGPPTCADIIRTCGFYNSPQTTAEIQRLCADILTGYPFKLARPHIEGVFTGPDIVHGLDAEAARILIRHFAANHESPKGFFAQDPVRHKLPKSIDLTHLPAPAHPHLEGVHMQGLA